MSGTTTCSKCGSRWSVHQIEEGTCAVLCPGPAPRKVLGLDPGATVGWCLLALGASAPEPRAMGELEVRGDDPATWDMCLARALDELRELLLRDAPHLVAVERVHDVHGHARMGSGYAEGLARAGWIGGELAGVARALAIPVVTVEATRWRAELVGDRSATDAKIKRTIRLRVPAWPKVSNAHERDACGVALWAGIRSRSVS